jgi:hypothetical protein
MISLSSIWCVNKQFQLHLTLLIVLLVVSGTFYLTTCNLQSDVLASETSTTLARASNQTSAAGYSDELDRFAVKELYPTKAGGQEWYSSWDNGINRELGYGQRDAYDNIELSGDGSLKVNGEDGVAVSSGKAPRIRVVDFDFDNVEVTVYGKRISENEEISYQGFVVGARSKHYTDQECYANTYYGRFTYDGRVSFEKELFHGHGDDAYYPSLEESIYLWPEGIPRDEWIGLKFIIRTIPNEKGEDGAVKLELYRDLTDGKNGGNWEKVLEFTDVGDWFVEAKEGICNDYPHNKILFTPGFVFIRNDYIDEAQYKKFSIREID